MFSSFSIVIFDDVNKTLPSTVTRITTDRLFQGACFRLIGQNHAQTSSCVLWKTSERGISDSQNHNRPSGKIKKKQIINEIEKNQTITWCLFGSFRLEPIHRMYYFLSINKAAGLCFRSNRKDVLKKTIEVNISQEVLWCPECTKQTGMLDKVRTNSTVCFIHWYKSSRWGRNKCWITRFLTSDPISSRHSRTSRQLKKVSPKYIHQMMIF